MSRIGRAPITVPAGVTIDNTNNLITVKGPLGTLTQQVDGSITVKVDGNVLTVERHSDDKDHRALHGLYRALININNHTQTEPQLRDFSHRCPFKTLTQVQKL